MGDDEDGIGCCRKQGTLVGERYGRDGIRFAGD